LEEVLAACKFILSLPDEVQVGMGRHTLHEALDALDRRVLVDKVWIRTWDNPATMNRGLRRLRESLRVRLLKMGQPKALTGFPNRETLVNKLNRAKGKK
jgi:hypothetical protein